MTTIADPIVTAAAAGIELQEADFQTRITDLCEVYQLKWVHIRPGRTIDGWKVPIGGHGKGWPDLVIVGPHRMMFRELKKQCGRVSADQDAWITWLINAGQDADVWRPSDWSSGRIQLELRGLVA